MTAKSCTNRDAFSDADWLQTQLPVCVDGDTITSLSREVLGARAIAKLLFLDHAQEGINAGLESCNDFDGQGPVLSEPISTGLHCALVALMDRMNVEIESLREASQAAKEWTRQRHPD